MRVLVPGISGRLGKMLAERLLELGHDVIGIVRRPFREKPDGVIVQFGGQTPLNLARRLDQAGVPIIGTSVDSIDQAENREHLKELLKVTSGGIVFTTIQKFSPGTGETNEAHILRLRKIGRFSFWVSW